MKCKMNYATLILLCVLLATLTISSLVASAQINIAALAQFKKNQQAELTRQLQGSAKAEARLEKAGKHGKGKLDAPMVVAKPPLIKAQTRSFKGNHSDLRRQNMR